MMQTLGMAATPRVCIMQASAGEGAPRAFMHMPYSALHAIPFS